MASSFPNQLTPMKDRNQDWFSMHLNYALNLLNSGDYRRQTMQRLFRAYNGVKPTDLAYQFLTNTYGKPNKSKYIAYRLGRTKINLLQGEWLKRPLSATVETININAKNEKMRQMDFMTGAMGAKDSIKRLQEVGVDVMEGAPIPENEDDPIWKEMSFRDRQEDVMQIIIDEQIKSLGLVRKFGDLYLDALITAMCFAKIEINEKGDVDLIRIDPRDAIWEEIEGDVFGEKSPIKGARQAMPIHEILMRYEFTPAQTTLLKNMQGNPENYYKRAGQYMKNINGQTLIDVVHINWKSNKPTYYKISPKTANQLAYDDSVKEVRIELDTIEYETNKERYDRDVFNGKYKIEVKYDEIVYEATRIAGLKELDVNCRRKYFERRSIDAPSYIMDMDYVMCLFGTVDGLRVSLQQIIENFDNAFDITMYQILKELSKFKGNILGYDLAALPKNKKLKDIMYEALNDGIVVFNSAASGNFGGRNMDLNTMFKDVDWGMSKTFPQLVEMANYLLQTLDRITGINENREGQIAASTTATNANSAINASRSITEPLTYQMSLFVENTMTKIVESSKISFGLYKTERGENILGTEKFKFMQLTKDLALRDYGLHVDNGGRYLEIKQRMERRVEQAINAQQIHPIDALRFDLAETTVQAEKVLEMAWQRSQEIAQQNAAQEQQAQQAMQQQQLQAQQAMQDKQVQDAAALEAQKIQQKTQGQIAVDNNKARNKMEENQVKDENSIIGTPSPL